MNFKKENKRQKKQRRLEIKEYTDEKWNDVKTANYVRLTQKEKDLLSTKLFGLEDLVDVTKERKELANALRKRHAKLGQ